MPSGSGLPAGADVAALLRRAHDEAGAGRLAEAARTLDALLQRAPDHRDARNLAGVVAHRRGDLAGAIAHYRRAVALGAGAGVCVNLGFAHQARGEFDAAERAYAAALAREPTLAFAWQKMAALQDAAGRRERALQAYRRALALDPGDLKSHGEALQLRRQLADWDDGAGPTPASLLDAFARAARSDFAPTLLLALDEATPARQRAAAALFGRSQWGAAMRTPAASPVPADGRRLRIGYLSPDFREHAVAYLVTETIAAHDRARVEITAYGYRAPPPGDAWRAAVIAGAEHFVDLDTLDDDAAAARIRADGIDVLVDLAGYTGHARPGIAARRPAPTIAHWLGYIGTLGEPRLADYVIGDAVATPPSTAAHFSESLALMPGCFQPGGVPAPRPPPPTRASEGLPEHAPVFCAFVQTWKIGPRLWDDWCAVLRGVPAAVLWLVAPKDAAGERNLRLQAQARGVDASRLVFAPMRPRDAHLARLALADIALDAWPYNSGTTASDALRAGVPLLTSPGDTFVSRMAASVLHAAGLDDCVLPDRDAVVARAIALGADASARAALRERVAKAVRDSGLFDPPAFARDLERLYAAMHAQALAGERSMIVLEPSPRA